MNKFIVRVCVSLIVITFIVSGLMKEAFAGLIMEQVKYKKDSAQKNNATIYISNNKVKYVDGSGRGVVIFDLNTSEMIQIDNQNKRYVVAKPEEMRTAFEAQLAKLPPEQRAQVEEFMKSQSKPKNLTLKKTGISETIAGYESQKLEVYEDGKLSREIWTSKDVVPDKELDSRKMASYMKELEKISERVGGTDSGRDEEEKVFNQIYESGYPMKSVDYSSDGSVYIEEIAKVTKADIPDNEFQAPAGFKKVTLQQMMSSE